MMVVLQLKITEKMSIQNHAFLLTLENEKLNEQFFTNSVANSGQDICLVCVLGFLPYRITVVPHKTNLICSVVNVVLRKIHLAERVFPQECIEI